MPAINKIERAPSHNRRTTMTTVHLREQVPETEVNAKYEHIVENILRDKASGWKYDYYKDTSTGYDLQVGRAQAEIQSYRNQIKKYENSLEKITAKLEAKKEGKKLSQKEADALELEYIEVYKLKCEQMVQLDNTESACQDLIWKQYVQRKRLSLLHHLRGNFMFDSDEDYLRRGVTWVEEYIKKI